MGAPLVVHSCTPRRHSWCSRTCSSGHPAHGEKGGAGHEEA